MMTRKCSHLIAAVFMIITVNTIGASAPAPENDAKVYGMYVDEVIRQYDAKSCLNCSNSKSIQRYAALSCMKTAYFKAYRQALIRQMCDQNLTYKPHKVKLFMNQRFTDVIRSDNDR